MPVFLGIDHGTRRVGIAVSDPEATFAFALETHVEGRDGSLLERLAALVIERGVTTVIVGLPLTADGREGESAARARRFAERLCEVLPVPIEFWDERYSSQEADRFLPPRKGRTRSDREAGTRDAVAAELILQGWLDRRRNAGGGPGKDGA